jgi:hypothetical protein
MADQQPAANGDTRVVSPQVSARHVEFAPTNAPDDTRPESEIIPLSEKTAAADQREQKKSPTGPPPPAGVTPPREIYSIHGEQVGGAPRTPSPPNKKPTTGCRQVAVEGEGVQRVTFDLACIHAGHASGQQRASLAMAAVVPCMHGPVLVGGAQHRKTRVVSP